MHENRDARRECQLEEHKGNRRFIDPDRGRVLHILECARCGFAACKTCQRKLAPAHSSRKNRQGKGCKMRRHEARKEAASNARKAAEEAERNLATL